MQALRMGRVGLSPPPQSTLRCYPKCPCQVSLDKSSTAHCSEWQLLPPAQLPSFISVHSLFSPQKLAPAPTTLPVLPEVHRNPHRS